MVFVFIDTDFFSSQAGMVWTALLTAPEDPGVWDVILLASVRMEEPVTH